jgi:hypothetical protein
MLSGLLLSKEKYRAYASWEPGFWFELQTDRTLDGELCETYERFVWVIALGKKPLRARDEVQESCRLGRWTETRDIGRFAKGIA